MRSLTMKLTLTLIVLANLWATGNVFAQTANPTVNLAWNHDPFYINEVEAKAIADMGYDLIIANVDLWLNSPQEFRHFSGMIQLADVLMGARDEGNSRNINHDNVNYRRLYGFDWNDLLQQNGQPITFEVDFIRFINPSAIQPPSLPDSLWWQNAHPHHIQRVLNSGPLDGVWGDDFFARSFFNTTVDFDRDSIADVPEPAWTNGMQNLLVNTRTAIGTKLIILNGRDIIPDSLANGRTIERWWDNFGEFYSPKETMEHLRQWLTLGRVPQLAIIVMFKSSTPEEAMFIVSSAHILGRQVYIAYSRLDWPEAIRKILEAPIGEELVPGPVWNTLASGDVYSRDYTSGRVLANYGSVTRTVPLGATYLTQDSTQVDTVMLAPLSGTILLGPVNLTAAPTTFALEQNYPNPFNAETVIQYRICAAGPVKLIVYNILGQPIRTLVDARHNVGEHSATWNGRDNTDKAVSTGVYLYELVTGETRQVRRMTLLR